MVFAKFNTRFFNSVTVLRALALGALFAAAGFSRAGEIYDRPLDDPFEVPAERMEGGWSIGKLTKDVHKGVDPKFKAQYEGKLKKPDKQDFAKGQGANLVLENEVNHDAFMAALKLENATSDKDPKKLEEELKALIKKVTPLTKSQVISNISENDEESTFIYPIDYDPMFDKHGYRFFEFRRYKLSIKDGDKTNERVCTTLTTYKDETTLNKEYTEAEVREQIKNPAKKEYKTHSYIFDTSMGNSGILYMQDADGEWSKLHDN